jgi:hypothetical protein
MGLGESMKAADFGLEPGVPHDIGSDVTITLAEHDGKIFGLTEGHRDKAGNPCMGFVRFEGPCLRTLEAPTWNVESTQPLTLSPSILCRTCGHHGYIRQGRWVPD